jgi:hypothetical protein
MGAGSICYLEGEGGEAMSSRDIEAEFERLGQWRRDMGTQIMEGPLLTVHFEAVAKSVARNVAEDVITEKTDLCARCDAEAYQHALTDLTEFLAGHVAADLAEGVGLWLAQRAAGAS